MAEATIRAKFKVTEVKYSASSYDGPVESMQVTLSAVSGERNKSWSKWTPSGALTMYINNPACFDKLKAGEHYFIDLVPAPATDAEEAAST